MAPVKMFGKRAPFPRAGAWTVINDTLCVIFEVKDVDGVSTVFAHPVTETGESINVTAEDGKIVTKTFSIRADQCVPATLDQIHANPRNKDWPVFEAAMMGYAISDAQLKSMTALQRKQLGKSLDDSDAAQALIEESEQNLLALKRARVAVHPDAIALEEQIEEERLAFIASVEQRRQKLFDKLS